MMHSLHSRYSLEEIPVSVSQTLDSRVAELSINFHSFLKCVTQTLHSYSSTNYLVLAVRWPCVVPQLEELNFRFFYELGGLMILIRENCFIKGFWMIHAFVKVELLRYKELNGYLGPSGCLN